MFAAKRREVTLYFTDMKRGDFQMTAILNFSNSQILVFQLFMWTFES